MTSMRFSVGPGSLQPPAKPASDHADDGPRSTRSLADVTVPSRQSMSRSGALARVLRSAVMEHDWAVPIADLDSELALVDPIRMLRLACYHGIESAVYLSTRELPAADPECTAALSQARNAALARHLRSLADLRIVAEVLDGAGIPWLVVKGPVLAERLYTRPDLRSYLDVDVVVSPSRFAHAVEAFEARGIGVIEQNWEFLARRKLGELNLTLPMGTVVDLHWHLVNRPGVRRSLSIDTEGIFERSRCVALGGIDVRTTDPVDTVVHLAIHAALSGADRLSWLKDVERATAAAPDWDVVVERARANRAARLVAITLDRARRVVGAAVPPEVIEALEPSATARVGLSVADRIAPPSLATDHRSLSSLWVAFRRDTARATAGVLVDRALLRLYLRRMRRCWAIGPEHVGSRPTLLPEGNADDRSRYFAAVTAAGERL